MITEFELQGRICSLPPEMTEEEFWHRMIGACLKNKYCTN